MAAYTELFIDQGSTFRTTINLYDDITNEPLNVQGFNVTSQMRRSFYSSNASATFSCYVSNPVEGEITMTLTAGQTANIKAGRYLFDVKTVDGDGNVNRMLEGIVTVTPAVTR